MARPAAPSLLSLLHSAGWLLSFVIISSAAVAAVQKEKVNTTAENHVDNFNEFDWNLSKRVGVNSKSNVLLSPISLKLVLAMLYEGSRGKTAKELQDVLKIHGANSTNRYVTILKSLGVTNSGQEMDIGMKLFLDKKAIPKKAFAKKILDVYNATIDSIDFSNTSAAVNQINQWSKSVTRGHIEHLVSEADAHENTVLLLLNAVYFKSEWKNPFPSKNTHEGLFWTDADNSVPVDFMVVDNTFEYVDCPEQKISIVKLPYVGDKFAMYIALPENDTTIDKVLENLNLDATKSLLKNMLPLPVVVSLPKFNFEFASSLAPVLNDLGISRIFSEEAELDNIANVPNDLVVSNVIQKAQIEVNEKGTVAAAVSAVELVNKFGMYSNTFNATRPFFFFIQDETTRTIVFVGTVRNPNDEGKRKVAAKPAVKEEELATTTDGSRQTTPEATTLPASAVAPSSPK